VDAQGSPLLCNARETSTGGDLLCDRVRVRLAIAIARKRGPRGGEGQRTLGEAKAEANARLRPILYMTAMLADGGCEERGTGETGTMGVR
jgi:hypothetical protein